MNTLAASPTLPGSEFVIRREGFIMQNILEAALDIMISSIAKTDMQYSHSLKK